MEKVNKSQYVIVKGNRVPLECVPPNTDLIYYSFINDYEYVIGNQSDFIKWAKAILTIAKEQHISNPNIVCAYAMPVIQKFDFSYLETEVEYDADDMYEGFYNDVMNEVTHSSEYQAFVNYMNDVYKRHPSYDMDMNHEVTFDTDWLLQGGYDEHPYKRTNN